MLVALNFFWSTLSNYRLACGAFRGGLKSEGNSVECSLASSSKTFSNKIVELKQRSFPRCDDMVAGCFQGYRWANHNHGGTAELIPLLKEQQFSFCDTKHCCPHSISCAGQAIEAKRSDTSASKHPNNTKNIQKKKNKDLCTKQKPHYSTQQRLCSTAFLWQLDEQITWKMRANQRRLAEPGCRLQRGHRHCSTLNMKDACNLWLQH